MLKKGLLFLALILVLPLVIAAEVDLVDKPVDEYRLGSALQVTVEVEGDEDTTAVLSASLECDDVTLDFYAGLFSLTSGGREDVALPGLPVTSKMVGDCKMRIELRDLEDELLDETESLEFEITDTISWDVSLDEDLYRPGETIKLSGEYDELGNSSLNLSVVFARGSVRDEFEQDVDGGSFSLSIPLEDDLAKGQGVVRVVLLDEYGNGNSKTITFDVLGEPTTLEVLLAPASVSPGDHVGVQASVYDQEGSFMDERIEVRVLDPGNNLVTSESLDSGGSVDVAVGDVAVPGNYTVTVEGAGLSVSKTFDVQTIKFLSVGFVEGRMVFSNTGNVPYVEETVVQAKTGGRVTYQTPLFLNLQPNERRELDLNSELPDGTYVITFPTNNVTEVFEEVVVADHRSTGRKLSQGFSKVTGRSIINTQSDRNIFGLLFLALFIAGGIFIFSHSRLKTAVMGKIEGVVDQQGKHIGKLQGSLEDEKKKRSKLQALFGKYVDKDVLAHAAKGHVGMQKQQVTALFTDLRGFSSMFDDRDELEVTKLLDMHFRRVNEIVHRHGGFINKFIGDSVMAVFNAPKHHADHVKRTVLAGVEIRKEMAVLNERLKKQGKKEMEVGIGIDTGLAAVGQLGGKEKSEYTAIGVPVNVAFRLQGKSEGGKVLISDRVYQHVKQDVEVEKIGEMELKNISKPVDVYVVKGLKK
jgi:class 3 adenylate cyclase